MDDFKAQMRAHLHWNAVEAACQKLIKAGHMAYLAGGCVRDALLRRQPNDFDVATDAKPDEIFALFPESLEVGKSFGIAIVPRDGFQIEIATFRRDGEYVDGRRPERVDWCGPEQDALRRDFTVNALFFDMQSERVFDFVQGERDLRLRILRAVGDPARRFAEDKLRLLRAVRFSAQLGFAVEPQTWRAVCTAAQELQAVSRERVRDELAKMLKTEDPARALLLLSESGLLANAAPELATAYAQSAEVLPRAQATMAAMSKLTRAASAESPLPGESEAFWAAFLSPATGPSAREVKRILLSLKCSNQQAEDAGWMAEVQGVLWLPPDLRVADAAIALADRRAPAAERLQMALAAGAGQVERAESAVRRRMGLRLQFLENGVLPKAFVDGKDLLALGAKTGPKFGELIKETFRLQIEKQLVSREKALEWLEEQLGPMPNSPPSSAIH